MSHCEQIDHKYKPRENQVIAINETVEGFIRHGFHGLLLEMSLGKTKCALNAAEIIQSYRNLKRVVVICPKAIQSVWVEELPKQTHIEAKPLIWENKKTDKFKYALKNILKEEFPVLIVRLEMFQRNNKNLQAFLNTFFDEPTLVILDESSKIKNVATERTPRLIEYTYKAKYKTILTGTPWTESPLDIFSQMEFLHPGFWYKYNGEWTKSILKKHWYIFRNRYAIMQKITTGEGRTFQTIVGTRRTEEIAKKIQPYVTQQKKVDWLDLPEKIFQVLHVEMNKEQKAAYKSLKDKFILEYGDQVLTVQNKVTLLTRLRQVAGGFYPETGEEIGKAPGIEMLLEDVAEYSGKVIIAASYVAEIQGITKALRKVYGADQVCTYYGATKDREHELSRFENEAQFLIVNPASASYGLNLQFCSMMYLYSRPYSYEQNAQLVDRIHRPGQKNMCVYKDIIVEGSVQEKVLQAFEDKKDVVDKFDNLTAKEWLN
jgi:SNF2 family DNA or RNA helicase